ncbi:MAG: ParB/RepB/Spo0J family partition protein, partial [Acidobacteriota bacterium]
MNDRTGTCYQCSSHKGMGNKKKGVKIPGGFGKCIHPDGHCSPAQPNTGIGSLKKTDESAPTPNVSAFEPGGATVAVYLSKIVPSPHNPPERMSDVEALQGLIDSIRTQGLLQPIVVRPVGEQFEIVCGHRRFAAVSALAGESGANTIPAVIVELTDEQAEEARLVENLQREGLTEMEEAKAFRKILDGRPDPAEAAREIGQRLGVSPKYVMRRAKVAELPPIILGAWERKELSYGHLEQFLRLDEEERIEVFSGILGDARKYGRITSVELLRQRIDSHAIKLSTAKFDTQVCAPCSHNSTTQRSLFGMGDEDAKCLDRKCFLSKQQRWIGENLASILRKAKLPSHITGWQYSHDLKYDSYETLYVKERVELCKGCDRLFAEIRMDGVAQSYPCCMGKQKCTRPMPGKGKNQGDAKASDPNAPRVAWHGESFREEFYRDRIPAVVGEIDHEWSDQAPHLAIMAMIVSKPELLHKFAGKHAPDLAGKSVGLGDIVPHIRALDRSAAQKTLLDLSAALIMDERTFSPVQRRAVADYLRIDLQNEWQLTEAYLQKKTTGEICGLGEKFGLWNREEVSKKLLGLGVRSYLNAKKAQLISAILESGTDLS